MEKQAKAVIDETSLSLLREVDAEYLCSAVNHTVHTAVDDSGFSPSQWVLGVGPALAVQSSFPWKSTCP